MVQNPNESNQKGKLKIYPRKIKINSFVLSWQISGIRTALKGQEPGEKDLIQMNPNAFVVSVSTHWSGYVLTLLSLGAMRARETKQQHLHSLFPWFVLLVNLHWGSPSWAKDPNSLLVTRKEKNKNKTKTTQPTIRHKGNFKCLWFCEFQDFYF